MKLSSIGLALAMALLSANSAAALHYQDPNLAFTVPDNWRRDRFNFKTKTPDQVIFGWNGDDYPLARAWTLPPGVGLTLPDLLKQIDAFARGEPANPKHPVRLKVLRNEVTQRGAERVRRLDFDEVADSYVDGVIVRDDHIYHHASVVIDRGDRMPLIVLAVSYPDSTLHDCQEGPCDAARNQQIMREIESILQSFRGVRPKF